MQPFFIKISSLGPMPLDPLPRDPMPVFKPSSAENWSSPEMPWRRATTPPEATPKNKNNIKTNGVIFFVLTDQKHLAMLCLNPKTTKQSYFHRVKNQPSGTDPGFFPWRPTRKPAMDDVFSSAASMQIKRRNEWKEKGGSPGRLIC
jgi:hypothetical protein